MQLMSFILYTFKANSPSNIWLSFMYFSQGQNYSEYLNFLKPEETRKVVSSLSFEVTVQQTL